MPIFLGNLAARTATPVSALWDSKLYPKLAKLLAAVQHIDLLGKHFFNVASMGLRSKLRNACWNQAPLGESFAIVQHVSTSNFASPPFSAEIGSTVNRFPQNGSDFVGNGRYYGGGMAVVHDATIDDQRPDYTVWVALLVADCSRYFLPCDKDDTASNVRPFAVKKLRCIPNLGPINTGWGNYNHNNRPLPKCHHSSSSSSFGADRQLTLQCNWDF